MISTFHDYSEATPFWFYFSLLVNLILVVVIANIKKSKKTPKRVSLHSDLINKYIVFDRRYEIDKTALCTICGQRFGAQNKTTSSKYHLQKHGKIAQTPTTPTTPITPTQTSQTQNPQLNTTQQKRRELSIIEGTMAFHTMRHAISCASNDCLTRLFRHIIHPAYSSMQHKVGAIINSTLFNAAMKKLKLEMPKAQFVSVYFDTSNHKRTKMLPVLVRYFLPYSGVCVKVLSLFDLKNEKAANVTDHLLKAIQQFGLPQEKIIAVCGDNTNANFGGALRNGKKNVFYIFQKELDQDLIGVGCVAHIANNAFKSGLKYLKPFCNVTGIVGGVYGHFNIHTTRGEQLKEISQRLLHREKRYRMHSVIANQY